MNFLVVGEAKHQASEVAVLLETIAEWNVTCVEGQNHAIRKMRDMHPQYPYDVVILMRWKTPSLQGEKLVRSIRDQEGGRNVRIFLIADPSASLQAERACEAGVDQFFCEPLSHSFIGDVRSVLNS